MIDERKLFEEMGVAISQARQSRGISQESAAKAAGISRTYLSDVERGLRNISVGALEQIAAALGTTAATVLRTAEERMGATLLTVEDSLAAPRRPL